MASGDKQEKKKIIILFWMLPRRPGVSSEGGRLCLTTTLLSGQ